MANNLYTPQTQYSNTSWNTNFSSSLNRPQRNNNPGNIKKGGVADQFAKRDQYGRVMTDDQGHLIFPDAMSGYRALVQDVQAKVSGKSRWGLTPGSTLAQLGKVYAEDPAWANSVSSIYSKLAGKAINTGTRIGGLALDMLAKAIAQQEGFFANGLNAGLKNMSVLGSAAQNLATSAGQSVERSGSGLWNTVTNWGQDFGRGISIALKNLIGMNQGQQAQQAPMTAGPMSNLTDVGKMVGMPQQNQIQQMLQQYQNRQQQQQPNLNLAQPMQQNQFQRMAPNQPKGNAYTGKLDVDSMRSFPNVIDQIQQNREALRPRAPFNPMQQSAPYPNIQQQGIPRPQI